MTEFKTERVYTAQHMSESADRSQLELKARKYTLQKWLEHYLLDELKQLPENQKCIMNILLNRHQQAAQQLQKNGLQKLALIVAAGGNKHSQMTMNIQRTNF